jgi:ubiquitin-activating enzyme E1
MQFYFREADVGTPRARACWARLADLNRNVKVECIDAALDATLLGSGQFQAVVLTEGTRAEQVRVNALCRQFNIGFIAADIRGVAASCFVDLGDRFVVNDSTGENPLSQLISHISQVRSICRLAFQFLHPDIHVCVRVHACLHDVFQCMRL